MFTICEILCCGIQEASAIPFSISSAAIPERDCANVASQLGFQQDNSYAGHFLEYKKLLERLLNHDLRMFALDRQASIVDIGCGFGENLEALEKSGFLNLCGVEPDPACRMTAHKKGFKVWDGTLECTSLTTESIDAAIVNNVFHHVDNYKCALEELHRIIKPGGFLCFVEPAPTMLRRVMDFVTFETPARTVIAPVEMRYRVMKLEVDTGLYPQFLDNQPLFCSLLKQNFNPVWHKTASFFQFGKYQKRV